MPSTMSATNTPSATIFPVRSSDSLDDVNAMGAGSPEPTWSIGCGQPCDGREWFTRRITANAGSGARQANGSGRGRGAKRRALTPSWTRQESGPATSGGATTASAIARSLLLVVDGNRIDLLS